MKRLNSHRHIRLLYLLLIIIVGLCACTTKKLKLTPLYAEDFKGSFSVPQGYDTYTLFFATSYDYVESLSKKDLSKLHKCIKQFGKSIGKKNLVVWVRNPEDESLNVELGKTYADRFYRWYGLRMDYSKGPYIVFMTKHPDKMPEQEDFAAAISFYYKTPKRMVESIEHLEASIRRGITTKDDVTHTSFWLSFSSFVEKNTSFLKEIVLELSKR